MKVNREQFLAAAALLMAANTGCGTIGEKVGQRLGITKAPEVADAGAFVIPAVPLEQAPGTTPGPTPAAKPGVAPVKVAGGVKPVVQAGAIPTSTVKGFVAPANETVAVGGPSREVAAPAREVAAPAREVAGPSRELGGPSREARGPAREATGPSREVPAPAREVGGPKPPPGPKRG